MPAKLGVQVCEGLVEEEQFQVARKCAGDRHSLLLATGKIPGESAHQALDIDASYFSNGFDVSWHFVFAIAQAQEKTYGFATFPVRDQHVVLEYHADSALFDRNRVKRHIVVIDFARVGVVQAGDQAQEGRLAAAGRAQQDHSFAVLYAQIEVLDGQDRRQFAAFVVKGFAHVLERDRSHAVLPGVRLS